MTNFREKLNSHLPVILQLLSTASLVIIALSAICGSKSLKKLSDSHQMPPEASSQIHSHHKK